MKLASSLLVVAVLVLAFSVEDTAAFYGMGYPLTYAYAIPTMPMGGMGMMGMGGMGMGGMMGGFGGMGGMGYGMGMGMGKKK